MIKLLPYYIYQVDAIESWLDEQAEKGLFLTEYVSPQVMHFRKDAPRPVRYRVDVKRNTGTYGEKERVAAYREMGWEYVCDLTGDLDVYRCDDPAAPELNTDEETLHGVLDKKLKSQIIWNVIALCLIPCWLYWVVLRNMPAYAGICDLLLSGYAGVFLCAALMILWWLISSVSSITAALVTRKRRLLQRQRCSAATLRHWHAIRLWGILLPLIALVLCLLLQAAYTRSGKDIPVEGFPVPTVSEVFPDVHSSDQWATDTPELLLGHIYLRQKDLTLSNSRDGGYYDADVYRIVWGWLAEGYARERAQDSGAQAITVPGWKNAWYAAHDARWGGQLLVLQSGGEVWTVAYDGEHLLSDVLYEYAR